MYVYTQDCLLCKQNASSLSLTFLAISWTQVIIKLQLGGIQSYIIIALVYTKWVLITSSGHNSSSIECSILINYDHTLSHRIWSLKKLIHQYNNSLSIHVLYYVQSTYRYSVNVKTELLICHWKFSYH